VDAMSDMKSKIPDLKELASMTGKLYKDVKTSIVEIIQDYKEVRAQSGVNDDNSGAKPETTKAAEESKPEKN
jgi:hypothetical protein